MVKKQNKFKMKQIPLWMIVVALAVIVYFAGSKISSTTTNLDPIEGSWDISAQVAEQNLDQYLVETQDFDYSDPAVYSLAQEIKQSTESPYDAAKKTARYVFDNVKYNPKISIAYCYDETAASVLEAGTGDCVSMTRLVTALLRAQGIPSRTMGGCLSSTQRCSPLFAAYPLQDAQVTPMVDGDFKKRGFLHEWLDFWTAETGWLRIEATSGQIFPVDCGAYMFYSYDSNQYNRCTITSASFYNSCQNY